MSNTSYGKEDMSIWARKALDYAVQTDRTAVDLINMSGLYRRIWEEIATASEKEYVDTFETMKRKAPVTNNWEQQTKIIEEIRGYALAARWEYLRTAVDALLDACWEKEELSEIKEIRIADIA
ncbi:MAG: hypothetical protein IJD85_03975 [Oscillospiraceae bacterium]|nr:hypothetical protein [Oscillospiraceae bacterium]